MAKTEVLLVKDEHAGTIREAIDKAAEAWSDWAEKSGEEWGPAGTFEEHTGPDGWTVFDRHESGTDYGSYTLTASGKLDDLLEELGVVVPFRIETVYYEHPYTASGWKDRQHASRSLAAAIADIDSESGE